MASWRSSYSHQRGPPANRSSLIHSQTTTAAAGRASVPPNRVAREKREGQIRTDKHSTGEQSLDRRHTRSGPERRLVREDEARGRVRNATDANASPFLSLTNNLLN